MHYISDGQNDTESIDMIIITDYDTMHTYFLKWY